MVSFRKINGREKDPWPKTLGQSMSSRLLERTAKFSIKFGRDEVVKNQLDLFTDIVQPQSVADVPITHERFSKIS